MKQINLRKTALALSAAALIAGPQVAQACSDSPYMGTLCTFATSYCPQGYLPADGRTLNVSQYQALYSLLGINYGGDGRTTFALPDLRGRIVVGAGAGTGLTPLNLGVKDGQEKVTLSTNQIAPHTHPATFTGGSGSAQASGNVSLPVTVNVPSQNVSVSGNVKIANSTASGVQAVSANAVLAKGGGQASIYAPSTVTADTNIGPSQTFTGATTAASINTTAAGTVTLPVSGSTTGGTVTVNANTPSPSQTAVPTIPPRQALNVCIAVEGLYPVRP